LRKIQSDHVHCVLDPGCASRRLFEAISGKWSLLVVMALKDGGKKPLKPLCPAVYRRAVRKRTI
jgi:DNA-binding HxlR family transcriptional regulator